MDDVPRIILGHELFDMLGDLFNFETDRVIRVSIIASIGEPVRVEVIQFGDIRLEEADWVEAGLRPDRVALDIKMLGAQRKQQDT